MIRFFVFVCSAAILFSMLSACSDTKPPDIVPESVTSELIRKEPFDADGFPNITISASTKGLTETSSQDMIYTVTDWQEPPGEYRTGEFVSLVERPYPTLFEGTDLFITLYGEVPDKVLVGDSVLNEGTAPGMTLKLDGTIRWTLEQGLSPDDDGNCQYHLFLLDTSLHPASRTTEKYNEQLRGVTLVCTWGEQSYAYHFVFRYKWKQ
ncbi:MAG: hypothetical protein ACOX6U_02880 [Oscillospiraceae bacterium]|jgi:hypothetical protein